jgi:hypothetical protein
MAMRKWMLIIIPTLCILLFTAVLGGGILKKPFGKGDHLLKSMQQLEKTVKDKKWEQAKTNSKQAYKAWDHVSNRIQYSVEREYMNDIAGILARIKGGIEAEDDKGLLKEIYYFYEVWDNLGT